ncbi:MAG: hypothetical protein H3Z52_02460 [archaeon]|nr:hypothetical protein [archaeon]
MVTKVSADVAKICGKKAVVTTKMNSSGNVDIIVESDCENIKSFAENLKEIGIKDSCMPFVENSVFILAGKNNVTPSCIVPSAIVNAVWIEAGLIARSLALNAKELKILFEEV